MAEIAGLKLITPSSVAGSGVSLSGAKVVFTAATSVSVNGVFDGTFDNYLVVATHKHNASTNVDLDCRLRVSGSDASGSNYTDQYIYADSTTVGGGRQASKTAFRFASFSSTAESGSHTYFYGPALAQPTAMRLVSCQATGGARIVDNAATHSPSTAYDGFTLFMASGNATGALCVYGLSQ